MSILTWIILGLISGFLASKIVNKTGEGFLLESFSASSAESSEAGCSNTSEDRE